MDSRLTDVLLYALPFALLTGGVFMAFQDVRAGGVLFLSAGLLSIWRRHEMTATQTYLESTRWRFLFRGGSAELRPQIFLLWGIGVIAVGIYWIVSG